MAVSLNGDGTITGLSTLNSVTITGLTSLTTTDLTADTTTLVVDSANNRVGIGTASPSTTLQVVGTATATAFSGPLTGNVTGDVSGNAGTVTNGVYTTDIGSTVQAYDADTTKNDVANTFTANQTINGNLTVDTNTLFVDSVNNQVGIGTSSPHGALSVLGQGRIVTIGSGPTANTPELKARNAADTGYAFFDISTYRTKFFTEGSERMVIREDGNVGIGTSIPSETLHVVNGTSSGGLIQYDGTSNTEFGLRIQSNISGGNFESDFANGTTALLDLYANSVVTSGGDLLVARTQSATPVLLVKGNGNVGIGTSSPATNFEVSGNAFFGSSNNTSVGAYVVQAKSTANWNFAGLNLIRNATNTTVPRFIGMPLDGDNLASTTIGDYNSIWGEYDSSPTTGSTSASLNGKMIYGAYAGHIWRTNGTERMRIDSSGNVGIGTTSPAVKFQVDGGSSQELQRYNTTNTSPFVGWYVSGTRKAYQQWDTTYGWVLDSEATSTGIVFRTQNTERMRIDSSGDVLVGTTSKSSIAGVLPHHMFVRSAADAQWTLSLQNTAASGGARGLCINYPGQSPNNTNNEPMFFSDSVNYRFALRSNGGIANYSANNVNISDRREKTNFAPAKSYLQTICSIPVQTFNYIDQNLQEDDGLTLGVVAQDVQAVAPELVTESDWGSDGNPKMRLSVYQTDLTYALMKCIQEQQEIIKALETRIEALENPNG